MTLEQFREYLAHKYDWLIRLARSIGDAAEDAVHDKVLWLLMNPDRLAAIDPERPDGYFFAIIRNACRDRIRRRPRKQPDAIGAEAVADPAAFRPEDIPLDDAKDTALTAIRSVKLSDKEQLAFTAFWRGDGKRRQALDALDLTGTPQELYKDFDGPLCRARTKLRNALGPHRDLLVSLEYHWLWHAINDEICGDSPEPPIHD